MTITIDPDIKTATRESYGKALLALGNERPEIVVLDADLSGSTKTKDFSKAHPERFFNMGVAECNMMGTAAGLSLTGLVPFASSFAMFAAGKAYEQIRQEIALPDANVKICATHAGITVGEDGASHQVLEDIALMRILPNMRVVVPADGNEAEAAVRAAADVKGPVYIRLSRMKTPIFMPADAPFEFGKIPVLRDGNDVTIAAVGVCVSYALEAADKLADEGISARVLNVACVKPLDVETLVAASKETGRIVTVEEHQRACGVGSAIVEALADTAPCPVVRLGINDRFGESGTGPTLIKYFGLDSQGIADSARALARA